MQALLEGDGLHARTENTVFVAVTVWLAAHGNDAAAAASLAPLLRFPQLTSTFLIDVVPQARAQHRVQGTARGFSLKGEPRLRSGAAAAYPAAHMHVCCTGHFVNFQPLIWALDLESEISLRQASWIAGCPEAQRMRVEALGYRAAHAAHQEVMRSGLRDGRGMRGSPLRFVPRSQLCGHAARNLVHLRWLVIAHVEGPGLFLTGL